MAEKGGIDPPFFNKGGCAMNYKKIFMAVLYVCLFMPLISQNMVMASENIFPEKYINKQNGVTFETNIEVPEKLDFSKIKTGTAKLQYPKSEQAISEIAADIAIVDQDISSIEWKGKTVDISYYTLEDGSTLNLDTILTYTTPFFDDILNVFRVEKTDVFNADNYSQENNFSYISSEDAFQYIVDMINRCGYELGETNYEYYALDAETMQQQEIIADKAGDNSISEPREWNKEDDCYYFFAEQVYEGLPIYYGNQTFPDDGVTNRPVQAVYSSRGVEGLYVNKVYSITESGEKVSLLEFDKLAEKISDKYGNLLTSASYYVNRAKLYYMPVAVGVEDYELRPVWLFEIHEKGIDSETENEYETTLYTFLDAQTGEEVVV